MAEQQIEQEQKDDLKKFLDKKIDNIFNEAEDGGVIGDIIDKYIK